MNRSGCKFATSNYNDIGKNTNFKNLKLYPYPYNRNPLFYEEAISKRIQWHILWFLCISFHTIFKDENCVSFVKIKNNYFKPQLLSIFIKSIVWI